jgi:hypothetical protein
VKIRSRNRLGIICFLGLGLALVLVNPIFAGINGIGVVKHTKGTVRATIAGVEGELKGADIVVTGEKVESGQDGNAVLRLLPDQAFMEVRPKTIFAIKRVKSKEQYLRRVKMELGEVVFGLKKKSEPIQCESMNTQAIAKSGRFACRTDEKGTAVILVQDGEISVYNRPKDLTIVVRSGQKAVSDANGIKVSDATDSELEQVGFRQNTMEVDFVNPETEEFTTLEVEYETNF